MSLQTRLKRKPRISVVVGDLVDSYILQIFERMLDQYDVEIYSIENKEFLSSYRLSLPLKVLPKLLDMPGYMRGLEAVIYNSDLILSFEASSLWSFQAIRIAKKYQIPSCVVVSETKPFFYEQYKNISAIKFDIAENADGFVALTQRAKKMLLAEGVDGKKIKVIEALFNCSGLKKSEEKRQKFREYIGVDDRDVLIWVPCYMDDTMDLWQVLRTVKYLKSTRPDVLAYAKFLLAGDGPLADELKYYCYDEHLSRYVLFLHQNTSPFKQDLYSAADACWYPRIIAKEWQEPLPSHVLESMFCSVVPFYFASSMMSELSKGSGVEIPDDADESVVAALMASFISSPIKRQRLADEVAHCIQQGNNQGIDELRDWLDQMMVNNLSQKLEHKSFIEELNCAEVDWRSGQTDMALNQIFELEQKYTDNNLALFHVLRLKGEIFLDLGDLEQSTEAFSRCLGLSDDDARVLRGLGEISFRSRSFEEALKFFKKSLALQANDFSSSLGIALVYRALGMREQCLYWLEQAMDVDGRNQKLKKIIVQVALEYTDLALARELLQRVYDEFPQDQTIAMAMGQVLIKEGKIEEGQQLLNQVLAKSS